MIIRLDPEGAPHWFKGRDWIRWWLRQRRQERESRAFWREHGPVVKQENMPRSQDGSGGGK